MYSIYESTEKSNCSVCKDKSCAVSVLNEKQLGLLNNNSREIEIKKGEIILRSGILNSHIIYLKKGYVKEFIVGLNKKIKILQIIKQRSYMGLHSLFGDKINHYSYTALEDLKICYIDINVFKKLVKENGDFAYELLVYVCKDSLNNFYRLINQSQKNTNGRFADVILYLSENICNSQHFELPLTRQELSELIGISRENTARVISKFK
ncbi:MAG: Crp/Fnr family transcriptional regulator [Bacteroidia bacterium]|nr:Crp/Fnr family transcriptional regulator [Bacteroidia bacterium]